MFSAKKNDNDEPNKQTVSAKHNFKKAKKFFQKIDKSVTIEPINYIPRAIFIMPFTKHTALVPLTMN